MTYSKGRNDCPSLQDSHPVFCSRKRIISYGVISSGISPKKHLFVIYSEMCQMLLVLYQGCKQRKKHLLESGRNTTGRSDSAGKNWHKYTYTTPRYTHTHTTHMHTWITIRPHTYTSDPQAHLTPSSQTHTHTHTFAVLTWICRWVEYEVPWADRHNLYPGRCQWTHKLLQAEVVRSVQKSSILSF